MTGSCLFLSYVFNVNYSNIINVLQTELWLAPLQLARATRAATFLVASGLALLLFKIDSAATSAASILTTFKRWANRKFYFLPK